MCIIRKHKVTRFSKIRVFIRFVKKVKYQYPSSRHRQVKRGVN